MEKQLTSSYHRIRNCGLVSAIALLGACSGAGDAVNAERQFNALATEAFDQFSDPIVNGPRVAPGSIPDGGGSTYNGVVSLAIFGASETNPGDDLLVLGEMEVTASFVFDDVRGTARNFVDSDRDTYSGELAIDADIRDSVGDDQVSIFGDIGGTLRNQRTRDTFELVGVGTPDAAFAGDFYGPGESMIFGVIRGEIVTPDETLLIWDNDDFGTPDGDAFFVGRE